MPDYISKRGKRDGWRYTFHIPVEVREVLGKGAAFRKYIAPMPKSEALAIARELAVKHHAWIAVAREWPEDQRAQLAASGGLLPLLEGDAPTTILDPRYKDNQMLYWRRLQAEGLQLKVVEKTAKPPKIETSWDRLFYEWRRFQNPKSVRAQLKTIALLKEYFGEDYDARKLTRSEVEKFRDHLLATGSTRGAVVARLADLKAFYVGAAKETSSPFHDVANPAAKVVLHGDKPRRRDRLTYSPEQVRTIFAKAKEVRFGDARNKRHDELMLMLRLIASTGARPNEIAQLQGGDVREEAGVRFLRIQQTDAATGERHPEKSVKTGYARSVPLRPEVLDFFEYAKGFPKDAFIFNAFTWNPDNGRASWLINKFARFLRDECGIVSNDPTARYTLYSFRHTFIRATRAARIPDFEIKRLIGHKQNITGRYGGEDLKTLRSCINRLKLA